MRLAGCGLMCMVEPLVVFLEDTLKKFELRACSDCGCADVRWCVISHRPFCPDCNKWGAVNLGTDLDAINAWNKPTQLEKLQAKNEKLQGTLEWFRDFYIGVVHDADHNRKAHRKINESLG